MVIPRNTQIILALLVSSVFFFQNCATIFRGTSQKIPVTSNPSGAKIIVDGNEAGYAPLELKLKKKKKNQTIRIEKQGYDPFEIGISGETSRSFTLFDGVLGGVVGMVAGVNAAIAFLPEDVSAGAGITAILAGWLIGSIIGGTSAMLLDSNLGGIYNLSPKELNVTLTKIEEKHQANFIVISLERFQNIKWIRIKCADSRGEKIVNLD